MGRSSEDEGESSSTEQATCKDDNDDERPLKKARYIWQIKGKYHLRDKERKLFIPTDGRGESMTVPVDYKSFSPVCCGNDENSDFREGAMESSPSETIALDECPVKCPSPLQDIEEVIKEDSTVYEVPEKDENPVISHTTPPLHFIIDREPSPTSPRSSSCCFQSFLHSVNHSSLHVRKWQTKQLAKGIVDNTINKVLEDMGFVPLPEDADDVFNEPVNCNDSHQNFENEAVLMAIQSHGLQRNEFGSDCSKENETTKGTNNPDGNKGNAVNLERVSEPSTRCAPCACSLPQVISDMDVLEQYDSFRQRHSLDVYQSTLNHTKSRFNVNSRGDSGKWFQDIETSVMPLAFNSDCYGLGSSSSSEENTDSDDSFVKLDCEEEVDDKIMVIGLEDRRGCDSKMSESESQQASVEKPIPLVEHEDFLDQAVAVAIQKKGLSVFGCIDNG